MTTPERRQARKLARRAILKRIENLEVAKHAITMNLEQLRVELADLHERDLPFGLAEAHRRTFTGTARLRRLAYSQDDLEAMNEGWKPPEEDGGESSGGEEPPPTPSSTLKSIPWWSLMPLLWLIP